MTRRFWRANGPYLLILLVGSAAIFAAERNGGERAAMIALGATIAAIIGWVIFDYFQNAQKDEPDPFGRTPREARAHEKMANAALKSQLVWTPATRENCPPGMAAQLEQGIGLFPEAIAVSEDMVWLAGERDWWGWPDPPRYFLVGFAQTGEMVAGTDFADWPKRWNRPAGLATD